MQNIKPLQTNKPKIMSNKEAMEELEKYNPPKLEKSRDFKPQTIDERINNELASYRNYKIPSQEKEAIEELGILLDERLDWYVKGTFKGQPYILNEPLFHFHFEVSIKDDKTTYLGIRDADLRQIPEQISKLTNLQILYLEHDDISKIEGLEELTNLKKLVLDNNKITTIQNLDNLKNLKELYLTFNKIKKIKGLDKLTNLQKLDIEGNLITYKTNKKEIKKLENKGVTVYR